ncbi:MAG: nucleoside-diphosphate sugar epimerase [Isosphaeraceae bacterium]|jgi:nucleoside-diphosphate-sugar epimerase|nr:MAG: nucleoside-diphosphate sugar epimerase [Isosphaeraceae bacterium]
MRLLMTGGYGCIGSWIAKLLVDSGREVWIFDLREDTHRLDLLVEPDARARVHHVGGDVSDPAAVRSAVERLGITHILHLAGLQVPTCRADPLLGARVNVLGTLAVFEAALALKDQVARVVYASSAAVHAPPDPDAPDLPRPDDAHLAPTTHYGAFKVCNELNARVYWLDHGLTSIGLRPWTVYGVGRDFGVTSEPTKAIKAAAAGLPYHISYGGLQDLQYAPDVAAAFLRALEAPFQGAEAFNIRGQVVPIESFVATLRQLTPDSAPPITHGTRQLPIAPNLDDSRLQHTLGPLPRTSLRDGVADTYNRFLRLHRDGRLDLSDLQP